MKQGEAMSDHAKTLEGYKHQHDFPHPLERCGRCDLFDAVRAVLEKVREQDESLRTIHSRNHEIIVGLQREKNAMLEEIKRLKTSELQSAICSNEAQNCAHKLRDEVRKQKARIDVAVADFNPKVNALVSYCGCCGDRVPFDVLVPDTLWSQIPEKHRLGVLCLSCVDHLLPQGLDPALIRIVYVSTSRGTTALVPIKALRGEKP